MLPDCTGVALHLLFTVCQLNSGLGLAMRSRAEPRPRHHKQHHTRKQSHKPEPSTVQPRSEAPPTPDEPPPRTPPLPSSPAVQPAGSAAGDDFNFDILRKPGQLPAPWLTASQ